MKKILIILIFITYPQYILGQNKVFNLVDPVSYFINHEAEIQELSERLSLYHKTSVVGVSGIGKTQLARMYAYKNRDNYDIIWFFDGNLDLNEQFSTLANWINKNICNNNQCKLSENVNQAKKSVMDFLSPKKRWLLVLDNLKINQNDKIIDIITWENNGHIILCSQDSKNLLEVLTLRQLNKKDSIKLINSILTIKNPKVANELDEEFKGFPLLVVQGAIFLDGNKYMTLEDYKSILKKSDNKMKAHIQLVLKQLDKSTLKLLQKIIVINNQKFSKNILEQIHDKSTLLENLYSLKRFGLISSVEDNLENPIFEIHDKIKEAILEISGKNVVAGVITEVINKFNKLMPPGVSSRYLTITTDNTLLDNLEILLDNAENYNVSLYKILELRRNLMSYYMCSLRYYECEKMMNWLIEKEKQNTFSTLLMNNEEKAIYSSYLCEVGTYQNFAKFDHAAYNNSISYLNKALDIVSKISGYAELKFIIYSQLAQTYLFNGELHNAEKNLEIVEQIILKEKNADLDIGLFWFLKAKMYLMMGDYDNSLNAINKNIAAEAHLPQDTFTAPTYILKSEILNCREDFSQANEIAGKIYTQEKKNILEDHEIHARILTQLSRAQKGLGKFHQALESAQKAKDIYLNIEALLGEDTSISSNIELAPTYVAEADALQALNRFEEAIESYEKAAAIYYNIFRNNMKNIDEVSYLYYMASRSAKNLNDDTLYQEFKNKHIELFSNKHFRTNFMN